MGSGKSTFGKRLANVLDYKLIDLDNLIEAQEGRSVSEIFKNKGEAEFRVIEFKQLQTLKEKDNVVISTGGGTAIIDGAMDWMNENGTTIYLQMSLGGLITRLLDSKKPRPLLDELAEDEKTDFIKLKATEREPYYSKSKLIVKGESIKLQEVLSALGVKKT